MTERTPSVVTPKQWLPRGTAAATAWEAGLRIDAGAPQQCPEKNDYLCNAFPQQPLQPMAADTHCRVNSGPSAITRIPEWLQVPNCATVLRRNCGHLTASRGWEMSAYAWCRHYSMPSVVPGSPCLQGTETPVLCEGDVQNPSAVQGKCIL